MNLTTAQWADVVIIAYLVISLIVGYIKGFFRSIIGFVVAGLSILIGYLVSPSFVQPVTDWLYPKAKDFLIKVAEKNITIPEGVTLTDEQIEEMIRPMLEPFSKVGIWLVIGIISAIILSIVGNLIARKLDNNETLRRADRRLGSVLGLIESAVICILVAIVLSKIGLAENIYAALEGSVMVKAISSVVPSDMEALSINIPLLGETNLKDLFKNIEIRFTK